MAVSRKQRDALREQKKSAFSSMMQAVPTEENNAIDKNIAAYAEIVEPRLVPDISFPEEKLADIPTANKPAAEDVIEQQPEEANVNAESIDAENVNASVDAPEQKDTETKEIEAEQPLDEADNGDTTENASSSSDVPEKNGNEKEDVEPGLENPSPSVPASLYKKK